MTSPATGPTEESHKDVGSILKQRRMLRGQSLETAHQHTRIPKKFLQALEDNAFDVFPAPVYLRGFLKSYCDFLDVEFEPLWGQLAPKPAQVAPPAAAQERAPAPAPGAVVQAGKPAEHAEHAPKEPAQAPSEEPVSFVLPLSESTVLPFLIFAGLVIMGALLWALKSRPRHPQPAAGRAIEAVSQQAAPGTTPAPIAQTPAVTGRSEVAPGTAAGGPGASTPAATGSSSAPAATTGQAAPAARAEQGTLRLSALRGSWIRLETDGRLMFEGHLPGGVIQDFKARKEFRLKAADPQALSITLDGNPVDLSKYPVAPDGTRTIQR